MKKNGGGDSIAQCLAYLLLDPAAQCSIPSIPQKVSERKIVVAEVNQLRGLEESGQWFENVDQTHLVLASGKLLFQKSIMNILETQK